MNLGELRKKIDNIMHVKEVVASKVKDNEKTLIEVQQDLEDSKTAQVVVQIVAQAVQQQFHQKVSGIVSKCLTAVFQNPYDFRIDFVRKRGKTEASMVFIRDGRECTDPLNQIGGGVIDVASFALRLCCVMMSRPNRDRVLVLDEPFRNIRGKRNKQQIRSLLTKVADDLGFQIILNVDNEAYPEFVLGDVIELE